MPRFPYINAPFPYYNRHLYKQSIAPSPFFNNYKSPNLCYNSNSSAIPYIVETNDCRDFKDKKNKSINNNNDYLFDLFGLKIYNDDVLLVSLLYFLYSEGVKDEGLFIVLILLLLS